ncbi:MAG: hypothetical protein A3B23_01490 [Candidatus Colwellbacteria bacterium RIFCSPLOWO2_01_FULL_48_10]|uniref:Diacylglycerol kinase n=1 Tax=Candidatus Colwellbacteria bacterium RIFCSPLOWO2_01_FULL_48_10 TaxID=1797690 RepID=A0A1G1Z396_9BACT|nr:MAG: hypothetical protein A3B23_01490 [Candidatus Colwellbacteria bacterium RIFCSPLOWO2_01_FULL_48_10]
MITKLARSFRAAFNGFKDVLVFEHTFRVMCVVGVLVIAAMFYFPTTRLEKAVLLVAVFMVLVLELVNSVVERIMDFVHKEHHPEVGEIKDLMASISLIVCCAAVAIGLTIFWPYIASFIL